MNEAYRFSDDARLKSSAFALNPDLDIASLAKRFASSGRIQIADFLTFESADRLRLHLEQSNRWRHIFNAEDRTYEVDDGDWLKLADKERGTILSIVNDTAAYGFQYQYDSIRVSDSAELRAQSSCLLDRFAVFLSSPSVLQTLMQITRSDDLVFADCQATRYQSGDFLTPHDDSLEGKDRKFAYVLSLTPDWLPRWGGLLHFVDQAAGVDETLTPRFNALSLFAVGQSHYVSQVATYAPKPRISVTGWLHAKLPD